MMRRAALARSADNSQFEYSARSSPNGRASVWPSIAIGFGSLLNSAAKVAIKRRLDHFNCLAVDIKANREFFQSYLGFRLTEQIVLDTGEEAGMWLTATNKSYDFAYTKEAHGVKGRFHHITYALDSREDILRAADIFLEAGVPIETGPHKHAVQQTFFLYVFEPGGHRVEVANAGARLVLAPDWKPIRWSGSRSETKRRSSPSRGNFGPLYLLPRRAIDGVRRRFYDQSRQDSSGLETA